MPMLRFLLGGVVLHKLRTVIFEPQYDRDDARASRMRLFQMDSWRASTRVCAYRMGPNQHPLTSSRAFL